MAKGKIPIADAATLSKKYDSAIVLIFAIDGSGDRFHLTTYGRTKKLCRHAASLSDQIANGILGGRIAPALEEPTHLPDEPMQFESGSRGLQLLAEARASLEDIDGPNRPPKELMARIDNFMALARS